MTAPPDQAFAEAVRDAPVRYGLIYEPPRVRPMNLAPRRHAALRRAREQLAHWRMTEGLSNRQICRAIRCAYRPRMGDGELVSALVQAYLPVMQ